MSANDAAWFRMDRLRNETDVVALLSFDGPLPLPLVERVVVDRLLPIERFRQRAVPRWAGLPAWETDPGFALRRHLGAARVEPGGLPELVGEVASSTLDPAHPLWRWLVVDDGEGGTTLVAKIHHAMGDGFALVALLLSLADAPAGGAAPRHRGAPPPSRSGLLGRGLDAVAFARALARFATLRSDPPPLASAPLSGVRRVAWSAGLSLLRIRDAAHRASGTVNDLLVAAVAGALRAHLQHSGRPVDRALRALVPVDLRAARPDLSRDAALGNRFGLVFVDLPVDLPTPARRLAEVRRTVAALRCSADPLVTQGVLAGLGFAPDAVHHAASTFFARKASLVLTNVPGPTAPLALAGQHLRNAMFWVPHPASLGLGVSILSYASEVRIGVRSDAAALDDPAGLVARVEAELAALGVAGVPTEHAPKPRRAS